MSNTCSEYVLENKEEIRLASTSTIGIRICIGRMHLEIPSSIQTTRFRTKSTDLLIISCHRYRQPLGCRVFWSLTPIHLFVMNKTSDRHWEEFLGLLFDMLVFAEGCGYALALPSTQKSYSFIMPSILFVRMLIYLTWQHLFVTTYLQPASLRLQIINCWPVLLLSDKNFANLTYRPLFPAIGRIVAFRIIASSTGRKQISWLNLSCLLPNNYSACSEFE